ncbi:MAG: fasciclin domain-containing protein [Paracoccaceae bacterium]
MFKNMKLAAAGVALATALSAVSASAVVTVGGEAMFPTKTIVENAVNSADHTTLVAAVKAAGLVDVLNSDGPFTVFAPENTAFAALPDGTVETLLKPENQDALTGVLTYHVLPSKVTYTELANLIDANGGSAELETVAGGKLSFAMNGPVNISVTDEKGGVANITIYDVIQSNGVIHSIDHVLLPN